MFKIYENYHSNRKIQKEIIRHDDFTYHEIISILDSLKLENKWVLDIGCGVGTIDFYLASKNINILGIDISKKGILTAIKNKNNLNLNNKNVNFKNIDFSKFRTTFKYDVIVCSEVLEHIDRDKMSVKKINNLLKKGGVVVASSPSKNAPLYKLHLLDKFDREVGHKRRYLESEFKSLFLESGFRVLKIKKTEGVIRNFLFTNKLGGILLRLLNKWPISKMVTVIDDLTIPIFGESNLYLVAQKI